MIPTLAFPPVRRVFRLGVPLLALITTAWEAGPAQAQYFDFRALTTTTKSVGDRTYSDRSTFLRLYTDADRTFWIYPANPLNPQPGSIAVLSAADWRLDDFNNGLADGTKPWDYYEVFDYTLTARSYDNVVYFPIGIPSTLQRWRMDRGATMRLRINFKVSNEGLRVYSFKVTIRGTALYNSSTKSGFTSRVESDF
jgi:hypothetical protein